MVDQCFCYECFWLEASLSSCPYMVIGQLRELEYGGTVFLLWMLLAGGFSVPVSCLSRRVNSLLLTNSFTATKFLFHHHHHHLGTLYTSYGTEWNDNYLAGCPAFSCLLLRQQNNNLLLLGITWCLLSMHTRFIQSHFLSWSLPTSYRTSRGRWCSGRQPGSQFNAATSCFPSRTACASWLFNCNSLSTTVQIHRIASLARTLWHDDDLKFKECWW